jgi:hypothetical protein
MTVNLGIPLAKKLGLKPAIRAHFDSVSTTVRQELKSALVDVKLVKSLETELDFILGFATLQAELKKKVPIWKSHLSKTGQLWIAWPKKSWKKSSKKTSKKTSGVATDLTDQIVREIGLKASLVDVKVCAIDAQWSGLKFVYRKADRQDR